MSELKNIHNEPIKDIEIISNNIVSNFEITTIKTFLNMKILINKKILKLVLKIVSSSKKKLIKYKEHSLIIFGNCYEIIKKEYIFDNINKILNFNGEFFYLQK